MAYVQHYSKRSDPDLDTALLAASNRSQADVAEALLLRGASCNAQDSGFEGSGGYTPLMMFAAQGNERGVKICLARPECLVNKRADSSQQTALHFAAGKGHYACVRALVEAGVALVDVANDWGETPLMQAVDSGAAEMVELLLCCRGGSAALSRVDIRGLDATSRAARMGDARILEILIRHGADVGRRTRTTTALHQAALFGNEECVEALLEAGADPDCLDASGALPLQLAIRTDRAEVVERLLKHGQDLNRGEHRGDKGRKFGGSDVISRASRGLSTLLDTVVATAAECNATRILEMALRSGGDPQATNAAGVPALFLATLQNNCEAAKCLVYFNADCRQRLSKLHLYQYDVDLVAYCAGLQAVGAAGVTDGLTALEVALVCGYESLVRVLGPAIGGGGLGLFGAVRKAMMCDVFPIPLLADEAFMRWLEVALELERAFSPSSLALQCRETIRRRLRTTGRAALLSVTLAIQLLPLPVALKNFLQQYEFC